MSFLLGIGLLAVAGRIMWLVFRPSDRYASSGVQILFLLYAVALVAGGISALMGYVWSPWPAGLWMVIGGDIVASIGVVALATSSGKLDFFAIFTIPTGSLLAIAGPVGLGIAYLAQHITIGWSP